MAGVSLLNLVARSLRGLPLCLGTRRSLAKLPPASLTLLQEHLSSLLATSSPRDRRLLRCLVRDLLAADVVTRSSGVARLLGLQGIGPLAPTVPLLPASPTPSFLLPTSSDKAAHLNSTLQLLMATDPAKVGKLVGMVGPRQGRKVSSRWVVEPDLARPNQLPDVAHVLAAKGGQLRHLGGWGAAGRLVAAALQEIHRVGSKERGVAAQLEGELLELEQLAREEAELEEGAVVVEGGEELASRTMAALAGDQAALPSPSLATSCLVLLLNSGDWESVTRLSHANMPYMAAARGSPHSTLFQLARNLAFLMHNLRGNNLPIVKKFGKDVWEALATLLSTAAGKRGKEGASGLARERALVSGLLARLAHPALLQLVLSLLAALHNAARDDPATEVLSVHAGVWPAALPANSALQERLTEELLSAVLARGLAAQPQDPAMLRMTGDLAFGAGRHAAALAAYTEAAAVRTDFFQLDCGPPGWLLEEAVVARMVTCCRELGRLMQAVVLSQFCQEPNYAQAFKFLEDQTEDGGDSLYSCIWDMPILEFAMALHTKRGEVARRRAAKHCIWQLELNTNNDEEILNEAANVRRSLFLRSLATQFF